MQKTPHPTRCACCGPGLIELAVTLLTLWAFAAHLARSRKATALGIAYLYVVGGLLGALLSVNLSTDMPATGAPAAVCALIGARACAHPFGCAPPGAHVLKRPMQDNMGWA